MTITPQQFSNWAKKVKEDARKEGMNIDVININWRNKEDFLGWRLASEELCRFNGYNMKVVKSWWNSTKNILAFIGGFSLILLLTLIFFTKYFIQFGGGL